MMSRARSVQSSVRRRNWSLNEAIWHPRAASELLLLAHLPDWRKLIARSHKSAPVSSLLVALEARADRSRNTRNHRHDMSILIPPPELAQSGCQNSIY